MPSRNIVLRSIKVLSDGGDENVLLRDGKLRVVCRCKALEKPEGLEEWYRARLHVRTQSIRLFGDGVKTFLYEVYSMFDKIPII